MDCKLFCFAVLCMFALCEPRGILNTGQSQDSYGQWRMRSQYPSNTGMHPRGQSKGQGQSKPRFSHKISLNNVNLAPGETKVIKQTIVLRGRGGGKAQKGNRQFGANKNPTRGQRRFRPRLVARRLPNSQGGAEPHTTRPMNSGLYLLRASRLGAPQIVERNGIASLHLPILQGTMHNNNLLSLSNGQGHAIGVTGGSHAPSGAQHHGNSHGTGSHGVTSAYNHGHSNFASQLLSGNPDILILQKHPMTSSVTIASPGSHVTVTHNTNSKGSGRGPGTGSSSRSAIVSSILTKDVHLPASSVTYTNIANAQGSAHAQMVQTTLEPGEDPPEAP